MLYIVPTPIGNLKDITLRALETLVQVDAIICEDTRRTSILLNHYQIKKPLFSLNDFNEAKIFSSIIEQLKKGQNLALVSDAGTPLIADPGFKLVRECIAQNISVDSLPGASAILPALTLSNLPPDKFLFLGYLPEKAGARHHIFSHMQQIATVMPITFIFFLAPFKLIKPLQEMHKLFGNIEITLAQELTKIHQNVVSKKIDEWLEDFKKTPPKGEFTILLRLPTTKN